MTKAIIQKLTTAFLVGYYQGRLDYIALRPTTSGYRQEARVALVDRLSGKLQLVKSL